MTNRINLRIVVAAALSLLVIATAANSKTIYVDADVSPGGGGTNWADAYNYLQDALADADASAKPVEIRVAQGAYKPDQGSGVEDANRTETFQLINEVTLKGGFAGYGEADPNARDITNYETILSGDLDGNDVQVPASDLLTEPTRAENSYHVVTGSGTDANAVLDGFTITAGNADGSWASKQGAGGGICNLQGSPTVFDCVLTNNSAKYGGGMFNDDDANGPTLTNCMFSYNYSNGAGGGMCSSYYSNLRLTNCTFVGNSTGSSGGGIYASSATTILTNCTFRSNFAINDGGGMRLNPYGNSQKLIKCTFIENSGSNGGGMCLSASTENTELTDCTFINNLATGQGGGMHFIGGIEPKLTNCTFTGNQSTNGGGGIFNLAFGGGNPKITNCTFSGNLTGGDGGGYLSSHDYTSFTNCTFSKNEATGDGGGYCCIYAAGTPDFDNCILWGNTAFGEGPQIAIKSGSPTVVTVNYCDVQGGELDVYVEAGTLIYDASNIDSDPCFVDADGADDTVGTEDDNLRLTNGSPCIDAGGNTAVPAGVDEDLNGFARVIDDLCTVDTGNPGAPGPIVDIGAYEFLRSDIDSDGDVNFKDFSQFALYWQDVACGACSGADLTCDGDVNWNDVRELVAHWLAGVE